MAYSLAYFESKDGTYALFPDTKKWTIEIYKKVGENDLKILKSIAKELKVEVKKDSTVRSLGMAIVKKISPKSKTNQTITAKHGKWLLKQRPVEDNYYWVNIYEMLPEKDHKKVVDYIWKKWGCSDKSYVILLADYLCSM